MMPYQFSSNQPIHAPELKGMESAEHEDDIHHQGQYGPDVVIDKYNDGTTYIGYDYGGHPDEGVGGYYDREGYAIEG